MRALAFLVAMAAGPIVITKSADVPPNVGKVVTLDGVVDNTKIPTLLGVDVEETSLRGERAVATGRLERFTIAPRDPKEPIVATRGPGIYYRLVDPQTGRLAQPRRP